MVSNGNNQYSNSYTPEQLQQMEAIIRWHQANGRRNVPWREYVDQLGHNPRSLSTVAQNIRQKIDRERRRVYRDEVRAGIDDEITTRKRRARMPKPAKVEAAQGYPPEPPPKPRDISIDHRISTSMQHIQQDGELRARIAAIGMTGAYLGDPMPGRSALDKQRAGLVEAPYNNKLRNPMSPLYVGQRSKLPDDPTLRNPRRSVNTVEKALA